MFLLQSFTTHCCSASRLSSCSATGSSLGDVHSFEDYRRQIDSIAVKPSSIKLGAEIGSGNYGSVYRASLKQAHRTPPHEVAVNIPTSRHASEPDAARIERNAALLLEAFVLHGLQHPRIISLVAVCTHVRPITVCTEYMARGDLRTFLRRCRPSLQGTVDLLWAGFLCACVCVRASSSVCVAMADYV